jgi:hypothetical protein
MTENADDKSVFVSRLKEFKNQWTFDGICVADSALYTAEIVSPGRNEMDNQSAIKHQISSK